MLDTKLLNSRAKAVGFATTEPPELLFEALRYCHKSVTVPCSFMEFTYCLAYARAQEYTSQKRSMQAENSDSSRLSRLDSVFVTRSPQWHQGVQ